MTTVPLSSNLRTTPPHVTLARAKALAAGLGISRARTSCPRIELFNGAFSRFRASLRDRARASA